MGFLGETKEEAAGQLEMMRHSALYQKPTIGRIVHYMRFGSPCGTHKPEPSPAIVVKVLNDETLECQLVVFNPNGMYYNPTPFSAEPKPGHWSWPARV